MRRRHELLVSPSCCLIGLVLLLLALSARAQRQAQTGPSEVAALNTIFSRWGLRASTAWNISGEPCSGAAINETAMDSDNEFNPAINCVCSYNISTVCHITRLRVYALDVVGQIPAELLNLTYLTVLDLSQNYLTGSLPAFLGKLTRLQYLSLSINALTGVLPSELGNLKNRISLYIDSCCLSGELPSSFSKLKILKSLWASDNGFTGKIPDYIGSLSNLQDLRLHGNNFDGPIPASFSNLINLTNLRIGDLTGELSSLAFVVNMTSLYTLDLRNSRISDNLASVDFSKFVNLNYLDLSFNSITGKVTPNLLNLNPLEFLFLGSNNLSGILPDMISPSLTTIDLSYNMLSGRYPSWVNMNNLHVNLVWNNFGIDNSNNSILPSGLNCLQRDTPCFDSPSYSSFAVDSGGSRPIRGSDNSIYEPDDASLPVASYYVTNSTRWGVSNIGRFMDSSNGSYIIYTSRRFTNTLDSELFQTARMSPSSLRYYGIGLKNGMYSVVLQFAEIFFPDDQTWKSMGKRIFNIYIQGDLKETDFDIKKQTNGKSYTAVQRQYTVEVTNNFIDIHLFWAGKGTCCIPDQGFYGPSISALSVSSYDGNGEGDPGSQRNSTTSRTGLVVGVVVCVAILGFLALAGAFVWRQKRRRLEVEMEELFSIVGRPNVFSYGEIKSATDSFSDSNILGRGGYGPVYKGKLLDGRIVAVKQLSSTSHQGKKEFMTEIATISAVQHRNLVKLHGCCIDSKTPLLVYEYLEQGSLDQAIFGKTDLNLDWRTRFEICIGIARGLAYLHEESSMRIVHRDIKASNVLLDADLNPKISDFGLARHYKDSMTHLNTGVAGTLGYLAPEYAMMGHLMEKADVFAFGVVALEIIAGRRNFDDSLEEDEKYLLGCAWHLHESQRTLELLDSKLIEFDEEEAARLINVALLCTMGLPQRRPPMSKVVSMLTEDIEVTDVDTTMRPSYVPEWQLRSFSSSYVSGSGSSAQQSSGSQISAPSSSSKKPGIHRDTSPLALSRCSSGGIEEGA
ncbi:probable LRR receptor-like serine/threonine-protein kinase At1g56140 [Triticum urartu]|uniref:probable LRR receptor-like serine/threonine-protein kinase At1g56140 n=1 Tax=Triticum urartu TaxID=4572 RepID=UPI002044296F|nr:probable LRR receptor-like serine/threonine-protein kinase At1g56140 [Triticum urartu]